MVTVSHRPGIKEVFSHGRTWTLSLAFGAIVAVAAALTDGIQSTEDGEFVLWTALLAAILAFPLAITMNRGSIRLDHPSAIMACVLGLYWLPGLFTARFDPLPLCPSVQDYLGRSALAGCIAAGAFYLGAGLPPPESAADEPTMSKRGYVFWYALLALLWAARIAQIRTGNYFSHQAVGVDPSDWEASYGVQFGAVFRVAPAILSVALWRKHRTLAIAIFMTDFLFVFFSGARLLIVHVGAIAAIVVSFYNRKISIVSIVVATAMFMLIFNPLVYRMRAVLQMDYTNRGVGPVGVVNSLFSDAPAESDEDEVGGTLKRASASGYLADIICLVDRGKFEFLGGSTYVDSVLPMVPRILWKNKPDQTADMVGIVDTQLGLPLDDGLGNPVMEAYLNYYFPGIAVIFFVWGLLGRLLWRYRVKQRLSSGRLGLYMMALLSFFLFETHSTLGLLSTLRVPPVFMLAEWLWRMFSSTRVAKATPSVISQATES